MNKKTIYGLICDGGDGSASLHWYSNREEVDKLLLDECYYMNEGSPAVTLTVDEDFDFKAAGILHINDN